MMGLLGNVAEVAHLRPVFMDTQLLHVFSDLLESTSDGIEVTISYTLFCLKAFIHLKRWNHWWGYGSGGFYYHETDEIFFSSLLFFLINV